MKVTIRNKKGQFIKGHKVLKGSEKGWFKKGQLLWNKSPLFKTGIWAYEQFKKKRCEDCGSTKYLLVHHIDKNRNNNKLENIKTVCAKCHCNIYHPRMFHGNKYVRRTI
jgi:hypothetical protein